MLRDWAVLAAFLTLCFTCEAFFNYFAHEGMQTFFSALKRPDWELSGYYIPAMATFSYACMAIAAWFTWRTVGRLGAAPWAFVLFFLQLALFTAWSYVFFHQREFYGAFYLLLALSVVLPFTVYGFWRLCFLAGILLLPYLGWVYYLTTFNSYIATANL